MDEKIKSHFLQDNNVDGYAKKVIASNKISDLKRNDGKQDDKKKIYENVDNHIPWTTGKCDGINKEKSPNCDIRTNEPKNKNKSENRKISLLNDNNMIGGGKAKNDF